MKFPATEAELASGGYEFRFAARCAGRTCATMIRWYHTPNGRRMPLSFVAGSDTLLEAHWATCPDAKEFTNQFRRNK
jgi:hypothetical protein